MDGHSHCSNCGHPGTRHSIGLEWQSQVWATTPVPNASVSYVLAGIGRPVIRLSKQRWYHCTMPLHPVGTMCLVIRKYILSISIVNSFKFRIRVHCYVIFRQVSNEEGIRRLRYIEFPIDIHKMWAKSVGSLLWSRNSLGKSWFTDLREKWSQSKLPNRPSLSKLWCFSLSICFPLTNAAFLVAEVRQEGAETTAKAPKEGHAPAERVEECVLCAWSARVVARVVAGRFPT